MALLEYFRKQARTSNSMTESHTPVVESVVLPNEYGPLSKEIPSFLSGKPTRKFAKL